MQHKKHFHFYCQALDSMVYMKAHINHLYDFFSTIQKIPLQHHPLPQIFRVASFMRLIVKYGQNVIWSRDSQQKLEVFTNTIVSQAERSKQTAVIDLPKSLFRGA